MTTVQVYDFLIGYFETELVSELEEIHDPEEIKNTLYGKFYQEYESMCLSAKSKVHSRFIQDALHAYIADVDWDEITELFIEEKKERRA